MHTNPSTGVDEVPVFNSELKKTRRLAQFGTLRAASRNMGCGTPERSRVQAGRFDHEVKSTGDVDDARPDELESDERLEPANNLRIAIHMRSTAPHGYSVRESSTNWRKLSRSAGDCFQQRGIQNLV